MTTKAIQPFFLFLWFLTLRWHFESEASWNCLVQTCQEWGFWGLVGKMKERIKDIHHSITLLVQEKKPKSKIIVLNPFLQFCWVELLFFQPGYAMSFLHISGSQATEGMKPGGIAAWGVYETRLWAAMKLKSLNTYIVHPETVEKPKSTDGQAKTKPRSRPTDFHTQFANYTDTDCMLNKHISRWMIQCLHGTTWWFSPLWLAFWETEASCDCNGGF